MNTVEIDNLEMVLMQWFEENEIPTVKIQILTAVRKDLEKPLQVHGLEGEENIIEIHERLYSNAAIDWEKVKEAQRELNRLMSDSVDALSPKQPKGA